MKIEIKFDLLKINKVNPNEYLLLGLVSLNRGDLINKILEVDYFTFSNVLFKLVKNKYIINNTPLLPTGKKISGYQFEVTKEGKEIIEPKSIKANFVGEAKIESWIDDWRNIFPKGKTRNGNPIKGSRLNCIKKMNLFIKTYKFSKDTIFKATEVYIKGLKGDFDYIQTAQNFIEKNKTSNLAGFCELIVNGYEETEIDNKINI
jgi:hypothetical protein